MAGSSGRHRFTNLYVTQTCLATQIRSRGLRYPHSPVVAELAFLQFALGNTSSKDKAIAIREKGTLADSPFIVVRSSKIAALSIKGRDIPLTTLQAPGHDEPIV